MGLVIFIFLIEVNKLQQLKLVKVAVEPNKSLFVNAIA